MSQKEDSKFELSKNRFVTVSTFKNKVKIDIREFYLDDSGERKPGRKGISLSLEEWNKMKSSMEDIDKSIKKFTGDSSSSDSE